MPPDAQPAPTDGGVKLPPITAEQAAMVVACHLRRYPWFVTAGVGEAHGLPVVHVYLRRRLKHYEAEKIPHMYAGFFVSTVVSGTPRAI